MKPLRKRMIDDMTLRDLAPRTIQIYVERVAALRATLRTLSRSDQQFPATRVSLLLIRPF